MKLGAVVAGALLLATATACSSGSSGGTTPTPGPDPKLVAAADLAPCPKSSTTPVTGGLPNLTLACTAPGRSVHLAGLTGKPTVVNLWGSWCEPCQAEEKFLSSAYDATHKQVRFLGVDSIDDPNSALDFDAHVTPPVHFPSVNDPDGKTLLGLDYKGPPETIFLNSAGQIVHRNTIPYASAAAVEADISKYLHVSA